MAVTAIGKDHPLARLTGDGAGENPARNRSRRLHAQEIGCGQLAHSAKRNAPPIRAGATQGRSLADRAHVLRLVATELKMLCKLLPTLVIAAMAAIEMSAAMRPYSMAVVPVSELGHVARRVSA